MIPFFLTLSGYLLFLLSHSSLTFLELMEDCMRALSLSSGGCGFAINIIWACAIPALIGGTLALVAFIRKRHNSWHILAFAGSLPAFGLLVCTAFTQLMIAATRPNDLWEDMRPYWGARPGEMSFSYDVEHEGTRIVAHMVNDSPDWVEEQKRRFSCQPAEPNAWDERTLTELGYPGMQGQVWCSAQRYDFGAHQAAQPRFICLENGDCIFYLDDLHYRLSDAIPPECPEPPPPAWATK